MLLLSENTPTYIDQLEEAVVKWLGGDSLGEFRGNLQKLSEEYDVDMKTLWSYVGAVIDDLYDGEILKEL